jgi:hypothetical protein
MAKARVEHPRGSKVLAGLDTAKETAQDSAATLLVHAGIHTHIDDQPASAHHSSW